MKTAFELMLEAELSQRNRLREGSSPLPGDAVSDISVLLISKPLEELLLSESRRRGMSPCDLIILAIKSLPGGEHARLG
jgi:hypothetical protein